MNDQLTNQYLALAPKRVPERGPIEGWVYQLPGVAASILAQYDEDLDRWAVFESRWPEPMICHAHGTDEGTARGVAQAAQLAQLAALGVQEQR